MIVKLNYIRKSLSEINIKKYILFKNEEGHFTSKDSEFFICFETYDGQYGWYFCNPDDQISLVENCHIYWKDKYWFDEIQNSKFLQDYQTKILTFDDSITDVILI